MSGARGSVDPDSLGPHLTGLVRALGVDLVRAVPLTTLPSDQLTRASFRLEFADGSVRKGRRLASVSLAERLAELVPLLDPRHFPRVRAHAGDAALLDWIEGEPLEDGGPPGLDEVREAGKILAALHARATTPELRKRYGCDGDGWQGRLRRNLDALSRADILTDGEWQRAVELTEAHRPTDVTVGLVHGDFCAENMVRTPDGGVAVVDNETVTLDVPGYDLGRTWYRWSLDAPARDAFYEGYDSLGESRHFRSHAIYWGVAVLAEAAIFRAEGDTPGRDVPVDRLRSLLRGEATDGTDHA